MFIEDSSCPVVIFLKMLVKGKLGCIGDQDTPPSIRWLHAERRNVIAKVFVAGAYHLDL